MRPKTGERIRVLSRCTDPLARLIGRDAAHTRLLYGGDAPAAKDLDGLAGLDTGGSWMSNSLKGISLRAAAWRAGA
jgi:hypothetical protein